MSRPPRAGRTGATLDVFTGCIAAGAFATGEVAVVGCWRSSPIGPVVDVMWVRPDGERVLLAPSVAARELIAGLYAFDRTEVVSLRGGWDGSAVAVEAGPLRVRLLGGPRDWRSLLFAARPRALRRRPAWLSLEDRLARPCVGRLIGGAQGVRATGRTPGGPREWYSVEDYRRVVSGSMMVDGRDAGPLRTLPADLRLGPSAFPTLPAIVHVATLVERTDPSVR